MPGEAVDEVIPAAVGLLGDDDATAGDAELLAQVGEVGGLDWILAQQVAAAGESAEELIVQVVSVGDDDVVGFSIAGSRIRRRRRSLGLHPQQSGSFGWQRP